MGMNTLARHCFFIYINFLYINYGDGITPMRIINKNNENYKLKSKTLRCMIIVFMKNNGFQSVFTRLTSSARSESRCRCDRVVICDLWKTQSGFGLTQIVTGGTQLAVWIYELCVHILKSETIKHSFMTAQLCCLQNESPNSW